MLSRYSPIAATIIDENRMPVGGQRLDERAGRDASQHRHEKAAIHEDEDARHSARLPAPPGSSGPVRARCSP
jgi:hypothetical protein